MCASTLRIEVHVLVLLYTLLYVPVVIFEIYITQNDTSIFIISETPRDARQAAGKSRHIPLHYQ